jgi:hypothetical protein
MSDRDRNLYAALIVGAVILAGPRRTRPLAGFLYGLVLSRAQGASNRRLEQTMTRLFAERESAHRRIDVLEDVLRTQYGGRDLDAIVAGVKAPRNRRVRDVERLPVWLAPEPAPDLVDSSIPLPRVLGEALEALILERPGDARIIVWTSNRDRSVRAFRLLEQAAPGLEARRGYLELRHPAGGWLRCMARNRDSIEGLQTTLEVSA